MKLRLLRKLFFLCPLLILAASCGGSSSSGDSGPTAVRLVHAAIDTAPIDLYSPQKGGLLQTSRFGTELPYVGLSQGPQDLSLTISQSTRVVFSVPLNMLEGQRKTILIYGNRENLGLRLAKFNDGIGAVSESESALRVVHALVGSLHLDGRSASTMLCRGLNFGAASEYVKLEPGVHRIIVERAADRNQVLDGNFTLEGGKSYSLVLAGEVGYFVTAPLLTDG